MGMDRAAALLLAALFVVACAPATAPVDAASTPAASPVAWAAQDLEAVPSVDLPFTVAADDEWAVALVVTDDGVVTGFSAGSDGRFRPGAPVKTGIAYLHLGEPVRFAGGWLVAGSGGTDGRPDDPVMLRSTDGATWSVVSTTGLDGVRSGLLLTAVGDRVLAFGASRGVAQRMAVWSSTDGARWSPSAAPAAPSGGRAEVLAADVVDDRVVAVGRADDTGAIWVSADEGASWEVVRHDAQEFVSPWDSVAASGDVIVAAGVARGAREDGDEGREVLVRSTDGGQTWTAAASPPPSSMGERLPSAVAAGGGRFLTHRYDFVDAWRRPEICYADIERCRQDLHVELWASDGGDRWRRVDISGLDGGPYGQVEATAVTGEGRVIVAQDTGANPTMWTWPAETPVPSAAPREAMPTSDVVLLGEDERPQPGRRYGVPLYVHCGMDWLYIAGEPWRRTDDGIDLETGAGDQVPAGWPLAQQTIFGFATLVQDDVIEYSIGGGQVIATYAPAAAQEPPVCA